MNRLYQSNWGTSRCGCLVLLSLFTFSFPPAAVAAAQDATVEQQPEATTERQQEAKMPGEHRYTNELIHSTSPYLLQHAHNPVNWLPWGPEAFAKAKQENKPIFVSIGYSTCYWCHVMERESFESEEVAKVLNEKYVAIKVDREQRPDIDEQLMIATQLLNGRGGWPNSIWLTSDGQPWMAGTYFPKAKFIDALDKLAEVWVKQPREVEQQAASFVDAIRRVSRAESSPVTVVGELVPLERALAEARQLFDSAHAGFGGKPKFPPHGMLRLLAFDAKENGSQPSQEMLLKTLDAIYRGGIHDHVGGGYHRYSTDERWFLPHFEKMLYDNAQLMRAYTEAFNLTQDDLYRYAVADIAQWLQREMTHPQGGFYSAIDSESDGEEGRYYTWSMTEVNSALPDEDARKFSERFNFEKEGNFLEEATGERPGTNIPYLNIDNEQLREHAAHKDLQRMREVLREARRNRDYPHLDDKVLASWNGMMISSLAFAGRSLAEPQYTQAAEQAAEFALQELVKDGKLMRSWRDGTAELPGYLEDYAFLADGLLELHKTTGDARWLTATKQLVVQMRKQFEDTENGAFYFTGPEHESLIVRSKSLGGGGNMPVANGVAASVLLELWQLTGDDEAHQALERTLSALSGILHKSPREVEHLVLADAQYRKTTQRDQETAADDPDDEFQGEAMQAELFVSHAQVRTGQSIEVAVVLNIEKGFYLYAQDKSASPLVQATTATILSTVGVEVGVPQVPVGEQTFDKVLGGEVSRLAGRAVFLLPATVVAQPEQAEIKLQIRIEYQACDATRCLLPAEAILEYTISVAPESGAQRHPAMFKSLQVEQN